MPSRHALMAAGLLAAATVALSPGSSAAAAAGSGKQVAMWHMDETSGSTVKDSASARGRSNGTAHGVAMNQAGARHRAFAFDGRTSYVEVSRSAPLNPRFHNITVQISLRTTHRPKRGDWDLIRKGYFDTRGGEYKIEFQHTGGVSCGFEGTRHHVELHTGPTNLDNGKWHTVSCTKTGTGIRLTVDGRSFWKSGRVGSIANKKPVVIGAHAGAGISAGSHPRGQRFRGLLDEASITIG